MLLITKKDFPAYVPFSLEIGSHLVTPHIQNAQYIDLAPLLLPAELAEMQAELRAHPRVEYGFFEFDPLAFASEQLVSEWSNQPLYVLFQGFVRPLLVHEAYRRMIPHHGHHFTSNGMEVVSDLGHQPISAGVRNELREEALALCNRYRSRLEIALRTYRGPAATPTTCTASRHRRLGNGGTKHYAI